MFSKILVQQFEQRKSFRKCNSWANLYKSSFRMKNHMQWWSMKERTTCWSQKIESEWRKKREWIRFFKRKKRTNMWLKNSKVIPQMTNLKNQFLTNFLLKTFLQKQTKKWSKPCFHSTLGIWNQHFLNNRLQSLNLILNKTLKRQKNLSKAFRFQKAISLIFSMINKQVANNNCLDSSLIFRLLC